jgi:predicted DNA-binding transcriptional regulator AlpA
VDVSVGDIVTELTASIRALIREELRVDGDTNDDAPDAEDAERAGLTPPETARFLGIKEATLASWRCKGKGPRYVKVGGIVRYARADVDRWLAARRRGGDNA